MHMEKEIGSKTIYEGEILTLKHYEVELENGKTSKREVIHHKGAVCVVAVDREENLLFVRQYRFSVRKELLELPAGKLNSIDEVPLDAALRELEEETGYISHNIRKIGEMIPTCGYSDEIIHIYLAEDLEATAQHLDEDEFLCVEKIHFEKALEMVVKGEIPDAKTQLGILLYSNTRHK